MLRAITLFPVVIAVAFILRVGAPSIDAVQSERPVARFLQALGIGSGDRVATFRARREVEYGLAFYLNRPIDVYERLLPASGQPNATPDEKLRLPQSAHLIVAGEGSERQLRVLLRGRELQLVGMYAPQHLQIFVVGAAK